MIVFCTFFAFRSYSLGIFISKNSVLALGVVILYSEALLLSQLKSGHRKPPLPLHFDGPKPTASPREEFQSGCVQHMKELRGGTSLIDYCLNMSTLLELGEKRREYLMGGSKTEQQESYVGRKELSPNVESIIPGTKNLVIPRYSYWTGAEKLIAGRPCENILPVDEYILGKSNDHPESDWIHYHENTTRDLQPPIEVLQEIRKRKLKEEEEEAAKKEREKEKEKTEL
uniref:Uncharacterized protein n=1 Tax=Amphimedon queenslandica TaxID=400682 RepID=A0A1X7T646_AMPQE